MSKSTKVFVLGSAVNEIEIIRQVSGLVGMPTVSADDFLTLGLKTLGNDQRVLVHSKEEVEVDAVRTIMGLADAPNETHWLSSGSNAPTGVITKSVLPEQFCIKHLVLFYCSDMPEVRRKELLLTYVGLDSTAYFCPSALPEVIGKAMKRSTPNGDPIALAIALPNYSMTSIVNAGLLRRIPRISTLSF